MQNLNLDLEAQPGEVFAAIPDYEGYYEVSNFGRIKSLERTSINNLGVRRTLKSRILKQTKNSRGYFSVSLRKENEVQTVCTHVLVAQGHLGHVRDGYTLVVDHINNNKEDNHVDNLQLITARENTSKDRVNGTSRYLGVHWDKTIGKWKAAIRVNGKVRHLGYFKCQLSAGLMYKNALAIVNDSSSTKEILDGLDWLKQKYRLKTRHRKVKISVI